jgi:hypothetical protein
MRRWILVVLLAAMVLALAGSACSKSNNATKTPATNVAATGTKVNEATSTVQPPTATNPPSATDTPIAPAATQPAAQPGANTSGVTFTSVTGAAPGGVARAAVQTSPGASCSISYVTPHGTNSTAQGLYPKTADGAGQVSWSWNIGTSTQPGTGTVSVTCNGVSASESITIG